MSGQHHFQQLVFSLKKWTRKDGEQSISNSQYLACLPLFNPYIHTICSLCIVQPTKVHLSTIYSISQGAFSLKKIVNLWSHNKSKKKLVLVSNQKETAIFAIMNCNPIRTYNL